MQTQFLVNARPTQLYDEAAQASAIITKNLPLSVFISDPTVTTISGTCVNLVSTHLVDNLWYGTVGYLNVPQYYSLLKNYEREYGFQSKELLEKWQSGTLSMRDAKINDWLNVYLQVKNFIYD